MSSSAGPVGLDVEMSVSGTVEQLQGTGNEQSEDDEATTALNKTSEHVEPSGLAAFRPRRDRGILYYCFGLLLLLLLGGAALASMALVLNRKGKHIAESLRFLVVGDWGREGQQNQTEVADLMALVATDRKPEFIISVGDNFYESGLTNIADTAFDRSFTQVYKHPSLQVEWHGVLGNHDFGEVSAENMTPSNCGDLGSAECFYSPLWQLDVRLRLRDSRWHCERFYRLPLAGRHAELFFIDTSPLIDEYRYDAPWRDHKGGISSQSWESQAAELEARLAASSAGWKLVVGHHPLRNNRDPAAVAPELRERLEPILEQGGVAAYFAGHEHNLQHHHEGAGRMHHITSGAGSRVWYYDGGDVPQMSQEGGSKFLHIGSGFVSVELSATEMVCEYWGINNVTGPLYTVHVPRP